MRRALKKVILMGGPQTSSYSTLYFPMSGEEICEHCISKIKNLENRIKKRDESILEMLTEAKIDRLMLATLMDASNSMETDEYGNIISRSTNPLFDQLPTLKKSDWEKIKAEISAKSLELREISRLKIVARNVGKQEVYKLSFQDLLYYEF